MHLDSVAYYYPVDSDQFHHDIIIFGVSVFPFERNDFQ